VKLIDRYILKELSIPFLISLLVLLFILLINYLLRTMDLMINQRVDLLSIGELILFILPSFLVFSLPMAVLIATIVAFARLTADSETIVLQANGIGFFRWLLPVGIFSVAIYFATLFLSFVAQPWGGQSLRNLTLTMLRKQVSLGLEPGVFTDLFQNMVLYVEDITAPSKLRGVLLFDFRQADEPHLIIAQEGSIIDDPKSDLISFKLNRGSLHQKAKDQDSYERILFSTYELTLDLGPMMANVNEPAGETSSPQELRERIAASKGQDLQAIQLLEEHYKNFSFPTSCLFFGLIGVPLGMFAKRSGRLGGFAIGLVMILGYYLMTAFADILTSARILPPLWAAWSPNLIFGVITSGLIILTSGVFSFRRFARQTTARNLA
jgi:lipopolysaccharide export system permease protein